MDTISDIKGFDNIEHEFGERFRGWYVEKVPLRKEAAPLYEDLTYQLTVCNYHYQFIIPSKIEFYNGIYTYTESQRRLGVFRFPKDSKGEFCTPTTINKEIKDFSEDELKELLRGTVLTFEAFRIPHFGFEYFLITDHNYHEIEKITSREYVEELRSKYDHILGDKISEVKDKILSSPNYPLILENVLNRKWKNLDEVALATNNIIHNL